MKKTFTKFSAGNEILAICYCLYLTLLILLVCQVPGFSFSMYSEVDSSCQFVDTLYRFIGNPVEQAKCLLRPVRPYGNLGDKLEMLPEVLEKNIGQPFHLSRSQIEKYLRQKSIQMSDIGGPLSQPLSRANDNNEKSAAAGYLVIHDTSTPNYQYEAFPENINAPDWKYNDLQSWKQGNQSKAHIFINRLGESVTTFDFKDAWRATKLEVQILRIKSKGLFLHVELIQPRRSDPSGPNGNDAIAPDPGFTSPQLKRLALIYLVASLRRGEWLIPAYHAVVDAGIPGAHDDPQHFDLIQWGNLLEDLIGEIQNL